MSEHDLPSYSTNESAGMDLRANIEKELTLGPMQRAIVPTGLFLEIPVGYEAEIRSKSGLAMKKVITVLNSPGTIDADCRGEECIILINLSEENYVIKDGERICQMIITKHGKAEWLNIIELKKAVRGHGGFGHTGKK